MFPRLEEFGFRALWSPYFFLFIVLVLAIFFYLAIKKRHLFDGTAKLTKKQGILFTFTCLLIYLLKGSPIDLLGHFMFTFHMIQMAFLFLLAPQLVIISIPNWMWRKIITLPIIEPVFLFFTKPLVALILFNGMFSFYHIPFIFDIVKTNLWYHAIYTGLLFVFAMFMWWPIFKKSGKKQLSGLQKVGYMFADSVLITPACALIIFSNSPLYETFTNSQAWIQSLQLCVPPGVIEHLNLSGPEMFSFLPPLYDQQTGGVIMKILQEFIYGAVLLKIIKEWFRKEQGGVDSVLPARTDVNSLK